MAGRDQKKLEEIKGQLVKIDPDSEVGLANISHLGWELYT
jgi:hypothetical protein